MVHNSKDCVESELHASGHLISHADPEVEDDDPTTTA